MLDGIHLEKSGMFRDVEGQSIYENPENPISMVHESIEKKQEVSIRKSFTIFHDTENYNNFIINNIKIVIIDICYNYNMILIPFYFERKNNFVSTEHR